uniref:ORF2 n=2 Tax=Sapporo virus TaxID=95342 RepID=J7LKW6_9CALI|nr:ORF2 [Sapovirus Sewage/California/2009]BAL41650.1 ORF2 protein [Sapovirus Hu/20072248/2008/JP]
MSWSQGLALAAGSIVDMAGTISGIVAQQRQAAAMEEANRIQADWVRRQEKLAYRAQDISADLAVNGVARKVDSLVQAGFTPLDARRLAGGTEVVLHGTIERPVLPRTVLQGIADTHHMQSNINAVRAFNYGTPTGTPPPPPGFNNPNYRGGPPKVNLGYRPPTTNV